MLNPSVQPDFPLAWGFSTRLDAAGTLPQRRMNQIHGTRIVEASDQIQDADGLWTQQPGLRIGVRVADCVPVLLAGRVGHRTWIAALHAGWRGAVGASEGREPGILRLSVQRFLDIGGRPESLFWAFGPSIQRCHFEVGPEVIEAARRDPAWHDNLAQMGPHGRPHLDLHGFLRAQAHHLGLDPARNGSVPRCTVCEPEILYSFRRGDQEGRQWGWIEIPNRQEPTASS